MTTIYKITSTRPSTNDLFWWEYSGDEHIFVSPELLAFFDLFDGFSGRTATPDITWEDINGRESELRPDLRELTALVDKSTVNPSFNPFATEIAVEFEFDSTESFQSTYNQCFEDTGGSKYIGNLWEALISQSNNTISEELYVDGVKVDFTGKFQKA